MFLIEIWIFYELIIQDNKKKAFQTDVKDESKLIYCQ